MIYSLLVRVQTSAHKKNHVWFETYLFGSCQIYNREEQELSFQVRVGKRMKLQLSLCITKMHCSVKIYIILKILLYGEQRKNFNLMCNLEKKMFLNCFTKFLKCLTLNINEYFIFMYLRRNGHIFKHFLFFKLKFWNFSWWLTIIFENKIKWWNILFFLSKNSKN